MFIIPVNSRIAIVSIHGDKPNTFSRGLVDQITRMPLRSDLPFSLDEERVWGHGQMLRQQRKIDGLFILGAMSIIDLGLILLVGQRFLSTGLLDILDILMTSMIVPLTLFIIWVLTKVIKLSGPQTLELPPVNMEFTVGGPVRGENQ